VSSDPELRQVLVVGAGVAGKTAAETLRKEGYDGELTIVGAERHAPYHRPPLSKKLLAGKVQRAGVDLAPHLDIDARVLRAASAVGVDMRNCTVGVRDGDRVQELGFDGLVIATGAAARQWPDGPVPDGVFVLRTVDDCLAIRERFDANPRVVVVGGGFIGAEVAATCRSLGLDVVLVERSAGPLLSALGEEMAQRYAELHRGHGVDIRANASVDEFVGEGHIKAVRLTDGSEIKADLVVIGLGVDPVTDWLAGSGLRVDNGVVCDASCAVEGGTNVVAAGDVARWWHPLYETHLRVEHWDHAERQAAAAARTLLAGPGQGEPYSEVPYFWSDQYDVKLQLVGIPHDYDALKVIEGDADGWEFVAAYGKQGRTIAVVSTIPGRARKYKQAIADRAAFPPVLT
jgi:NADPH-dependent 2,4-dienoyl-CoA reductase/sulfur reductase-like enzyme